MPLDDETLTRLREGILAKRDYAGYFNWDIDKDLAEWGVVQELCASLDATGASFFDDFALRGRGNDPPDLEAVTFDGLKLAIEVTELVDGEAIKQDKFVKKLPNPTWQDKLAIPTAWDKNLLSERLQNLITSKDGKFPKLLGGPYPGGYCVVVFTDEPDLTPEKLQELLEEEKFTAEDINRCFLLVGYQPLQKHLTYFELTLQRKVIK